MMLKTVIKKLAQELLGIENKGNMSYSLWFMEEVDCLQEKNKAYKEGFNDTPAQKRE